MSTRMTIAYGKGYHLYAECLDNKYVYLKVNGGELVESFGSEFFRSRYPERNEKPEMAYRIPADIAEQLFESDLPVLGEGCTPLRDLGVLPTQELLDLRRDALRFRWLSNGNRGDHILDWINFHSPSKHNSLGEAIDAALTTRPIFESGS